MTLEWQLQGLQPNKDKAEKKLDKHLKTPKITDFKENHISSYF